MCEALIRLAPDVAKIMRRDTWSMTHFFSAHAPHAPAASCSAAATSTAAFKSLVIGVFLIGLIVTTACSGAPASATSPNTVASTPISAVANGAQQVTITVGKGMNFEPSAITVRTGQPVELTLRNDGQYPHDFTLTHGVARQVKITVNGGETATGTFTLDRPGTYNFECSMSAHALAGMKGTITAR